MTKISVVREYRDRYPDFPNLKLARIIYAENKELFSSVEAIRTAIRTIQGQAGKTNSGIIKTHSQGPRPFNPYKLPESDESTFEPYIIKAKRILGLFDIINYLILVKKYFDLKYFDYNKELNYLFGLEFQY